jgi:ribosomal protein L7/L12
MGRTPTEVVRNLGAGIAKVDIYLRFAGYNTGKLTQIMTILMGMGKEEVLEIIERSPCMLKEGVPRDRARQIKTVLEGTGAKIAVVAPGEEV